MCLLNLHYAAVCGRAPLSFWCTTSPFLKKCCTAHLDAFLDVQAANSIGINAPPMKDASEMTAGIKLDGLSAL